MRLEGSQSEVMRKAVLLLALSAFVHQAAPPSGKSGLDAERLARIPVRMKALVEKGEIPGAVTLIGRHGQIAHLQAHGFQDIENRKPMRTDSIFQIMSMTKPVTGVAVMMLAEEGRLPSTIPWRGTSPSSATSRCATAAPCVGPPARSRSGI